MDTLPFVNTTVGEDLTRVTVISPTRRIDLALPASIALGEILPNIVRFSGYEPGSVQESVHTWVLQRLGDDPLDPNKLVSALNIRDGETLHLRQRGAAMPDAAFDDVVDAVATATNTRAAWTPKHSRRMALGVLVAVLGGVPLAMLLLRPDWVSATIALGVGFGAAIAAIVLSRAFNRYAVAATLAWTAVGLAGLGAFFAVPAGTALPIAALVASAGVLLAAATLALAAQTHPFGLLTVVLATALLLIVTMTMVLLPRHVVEIAAVAVAILLALTSMLPGLSYQIARIAMPVLPAGAEQLMADDQPIQSDIVARALLADKLLAAFIGATVITVTLLTVPVIRAGEWAELCLGGAVGLALLLRARAFVGLVQRLSLLVGGLIVTAMTLGQLALQTDPGLVWLALGSGGVVLLAAILVLYAAYQYDRVMSPTWGRFGDVFEWIAIMAMIPLVLAVLDAYTFMMQLGG